MSDISKNIKKYRTKANLTQQELADRLNVTRQAISSWENGKNQPDVQTLEAIAQVLNISLEEVLYGKKQEEQALVRNRKKLIKRTVVLGIVLAILIIIGMIVNPIIIEHQRTTYQVIPSLIFIRIYNPIRLIILGAFICSFISIFYNIHVKEKKVKRLLLVISIVSLVGVNIFFNIWFYAGSGKTVMDYMYVIFAILLFFGIAKEPEVEEIE